jgi:hypothetical protein
MDNMNLCVDNEQAMSKLTQHINFLVTDDKNLPILEKLFEVHDVDIEFISNIDSFNNTPLIDKYLDKLVDEKRNKEHEKEEREIDAKKEVYKKICTKIGLDENSGYYDLTDKIKELLDENAKLLESNVDSNVEIIIICNQIHGYHGSIAIEAEELSKNAVEELSKIYDKSGLSSKVINKILRALWNCKHVDLFKKLAADREFLLSDYGVGKMDKSFKYLVENKIKVNKNNAEKMLISYLCNNRNITVQQMKEFLSNVEIQNIDELITNYYMKNASKKISELTV